MTEREINEKYLGIPYKHRGRNLDGLDCYGFIIAVYRDWEIELFDIEEEYNEGWAFKSGKNYFIENYHRQWQKVDGPEMLDVVLFHNSKGIVNHGGIVLSDRKFIHCCKAGVVVSRLIPQWLKRLEGFFRFVGKK